ncbi:hypothetical protein SMICM17S_00877 [Streptomyces microflavus]
MTLKAAGVATRGAAGVPGSFFCPGPPVPSASGAIIAAEAVWSFQLGPVIVLRGGAVPGRSRGQSWKNAGQLVSLLLGALGVAEVLPHRSNGVVALPSGQRAVRRRSPTSPAPARAAPGSGRPQSPRRTAPSPREARFPPFYGYRAGSSSPSRRRGAGAPGPRRAGDGNPHLHDAAALAGPRRRPAPRRLRRWARRKARWKGSAAPRVPCPGSLGSRIPPLTTWSEVPDPTGSPGRSPTRRWSARSDGERAFSEAGQVM